MDKGQLSRGINNKSTKQYVVNRHTISTICMIYSVRDEIGNKRGESGKERI